MVDLDIIKPVQKPTDWVNGLVVVEKANGKPRYVSTQDLWTKPLNVNTSISSLPKKSSPKCQGHLIFQN